MCSGLRNRLMPPSLTTERAWVDKENDLPLPFKVDGAASSVCLGSVPVKIRKSE